jgi:hypothetical protein
MDIADALHGKEGNNTAEVIFSMLDSSGKTRDLGFALGYITHCALDMVFHPVIYFLSGNYYDEDAGKRERAVAGHRTLETRLDIGLGNTRRVHSSIRPSITGGLGFAEVLRGRFGAGLPEIRRALRNQVFYNRLFSSRTAFRTVCWLERSGLSRDRTLRGLFYAGAGAEDCDPGTPFMYRDIITGEEKTASVNGLMDNAVKKAMGMIHAAKSYALGNASLDEARGVIAGESLDTGGVGVPVSAVRYTVVE